MGRLLQFRRRAFEQLPIDPPDEDDEPSICPFCMEWGEDCRCEIGDEDA